jgi:hypothetical protein
MRSQFLALLLVVPAILSAEEIGLEECKSKFDSPSSNKYYYARLIAKSGDPGIRWLLGHAAGSPDGELEKAIGIGLLYAPVDVLPHIKPMMNDKSPQTRAFAVRVAAQLVDERFIPLFKALSADNAELPFGAQISVAHCVEDAMSMYEWKKDHPNCFKIHRDHDHRRARRLELDLAPGEMKE